MNVNFKLIYLFSCILFINICFPLIYANSSILCALEGQNTTLESICCDDLIKIKEISINSENGCYEKVNSSYFCTACGDGVCKFPENHCNCALDCVIIENNENCSNFSNCEDGLISLDMSEPEKRENTLALLGVVVMISVFVIFALLSLVYNKEK